MARYIILSDENCTGQATAIFYALARLELAELLEVELITWEQAGLAEAPKTKLFGASARSAAISC